MRIEDVRAVLRPRSAWQAIDLGCLLWQRHLGPIMLAWFTVALPLVIASWIIGGGANWASAAIFWWLFPLASRGVLFVLSRALFGDAPSGLDAIRAAWGFRAADLWRTIGPARVWPLRTFNAPVGLLEGLRGAARRRRLGVLDRSGGHMVGVGIMSLGFVSLGVLAILLGIQFLYEGPMPTDVDLSSFDEPRFVFGAWFLAVSCFETLHVAIGFAAYIDGRSSVEGWDVELGLRALKRRLDSSVHGLGVLFLVCFSAVGLQDSAEPTIESSETDPGATIERVLEDSAFGGSKKAWKLRTRNSLDGLDGVSLPSGGVFAVFLRVVLVVMFAVLAVVVGWLVLQTYRGLLEVRGRKLPSMIVPPRSIVEEALSGGEEALPADVPGAVRSLFDAGRQTEAAGLLYRASLVTLVEAHSVPIDPAHTESQCLRSASRRLDTSRAEAFRTVTHLWQRSAYATLSFATPELAVALEAFARIGGAA